MISLHTNLSSIITQNNMTSSTNKLNTAIERLSTGYKINHAGDNAANYSISRNMSTQLSACDVAADNIAMGMDLLNVAQDTISGMQDRASRIHSLITQARNGTYGATSLTAMTQEAQALVSEINRLYINTEYNGIKLFDNIQLPDWAQEIKANAGTTDSVVQAQSGGFIGVIEEETPDVIVTNPLELEDAITSNTKIGIGNAETLAELAKIVNGTDDYTANNCSGKTIILTEDVDLSSVCAANTDGEGNGGWTPIGTPTNRFQGTFNGNGHKVTRLYINRAKSFNQGFFGYATGELKDVAIVDANVTGKSNTGCLVGRVSGTITNCYAIGNATGTSHTGGLVGYAKDITNSYSTGNVTGTSSTGGLAGEATDITNSYSTGNVTGSGSNIGGLVGLITRTLTDCYATGNVTGDSNVGGLVGDAESDITNSYATGNVTGTFQIGGLVGEAESGIISSYSTGNVTGTSSTGGLAGCTWGDITNSYATGNVTGIYCTGGLVGFASNAITNSYAAGNVTGTSCTGGLAGGFYVSPGDVFCLQNILSIGNVTGEKYTGSFIGIMHDTEDGIEFGELTITNACARSGGDMIGIEGIYIDDGIYESYSSGQMEDWLENIEALNSPGTSLQVGIHSGEDSQISVDTNLKLNLFISSLTSDSAYNSVTNFLNQLSQKATELGAAQNRLESAHESNLVMMDNLTSSLSTIRDADISKVSSDFIRQQILQQACATLMSTANQNPAIALQLL